MVTEVVNSEVMFSGSFVTIAIYGVELISYVSYIMEIMFSYASDSSVDFIDIPAYVIHCHKLVYFIGL